MRHLAGAVTVIATGAPGHRFGLTATAVCSLSDEPPTLLVCVNRPASAHDVISRNGNFSVNLLADDQEPRSPVGSPAVPASRARLASTAAIGERWRPVRRRWSMRWRPSIAR